MGIFEMGWEKPSPIQVGLWSLTSYACLVLCCLSERWAACGMMLKMRSLLQPSDRAWPVAFPGTLCCHLAAIQITGALS